MRLYSSRILGTGAAFPKKVLNNHDFCEFIAKFPGEVPEGFSPTWIAERTGIESRHISAEGETVSELGLIAATRALSAAGIGAEEIDGILLATCTPEQPMPASATILQMKLGAKNAFALDLNAACSGFQHAWAMGHALIASGQAKTILLVGADVLSTVTDYTDRKSAIIFGDGAGAVLITRDENLENAPRFILTANGEDRALLETPAGGSTQPIFGRGPEDRSPLLYSETRMQMKGAEIFKVSVRTMADLATKLLEECGYTVDQIDFVVPHQANLRILERVAKKMKIPLDRFILNIGERGNTSAATVPTALDEGIRSGRIKRGHRILVPVFGAGITAGATIATY